MLPERASRFLQWVRRPSSKWVRFPLALLLMVAGVIGFLPILGFWMLPLGLILVAQDIKPLRRPIARLIAWAERKWSALQQHNERMQRHQMGDAEPQPRSNGVTQQTDGRAEAARADPPSAPTAPPRSDTLRRS